MSLPAGQGILHLQLPSSQPERIYHARRAHRKSRNGCSKCKQRRVKCDESKPHCLRCQKLNLDCSYEPSSSSSSTDPEKRMTRFLTSSPDSKAYNLAQKAVGTQLHDLLQLPQGASPSIRVEALHHFYGLSDPALGPQAPQAEYQRRVIQLGFESPYLMHAIIAFATSHLRYTTPTKHRPYALTETYHWQQAITQYLQQLATIGPHNMDGLFGACLLLTVRSFELDRYDPHGSFVFATSPKHTATALTWLTLQVGLRRLLEATVPWQRGSMWWEVFMASAAQYRGVFDVDESNVSEKVAAGWGLDPGLAGLCGIHAGSNPANNVYYEPVRMLSGLVQLPRGIRSFGAYTGWMGRLEPAFFERLVCKEVAALVVLRRWLELLGSVDLWWIGVRVRSEVQAINWFLGGG
ncbi:Zn(II)2Cys6 transcription factor domain-containing protein [Aspergillus brunneoviolaceus CBS 621.78]|uniref:Uncharacterized protein n=1 Tax=Aspergillus brunneoviolaceus CBS 621.78 TaxID=1450534 RepID=A0ACD1FRX5_9EURO|nr:hypothetical protein BO95DRAFT_41890 [Aspergillus brunneoviolaceus CBS 621.78]RAH39719.1 hypothetical protein BO95DRAFT_41890 [Aspergillus brunneoviolaceus CBS 621.78]